MTAFVMAAFILICVASFVLYFRIRAAKKQPDFDIKNHPGLQKSAIIVLIAWVVMIFLFYMDEIQKEEKPTSTKQTITQQAQSIAPQAPETAVTPPPHDVPPQPKPTLANIMERYNAAAKELDIPTVKPSAAVRKKAKKGDKMVSTRVVLNDTAHVSFFQLVDNAENAKPVASMLFSLNLYEDPTWSMLTLAAMFKALTPDMTPIQRGDILNAVSENNNSGQYENNNFSIKATPTAEGVLFLIGFK